MPFALCVSFILASEPVPVTRVDESQYEACGPCCLYMACVATGHAVDFESLVNRFEPGPQGETSLADLQDVAESIGMTPIAMQITPERAESIPVPFIAHVDLPSSDVDHFVLVLGITPRGVVYVDPPQIATLESMDAFRSRWTGNVLVFPGSRQEATALEQQIRSRSREPFIRALLVATFVAMALVAVQIARTTFRDRAPGNRPAPAQGHV